MIRKPVFALAVLLLMFVDRGFAAACDAGLATGVQAPEVTRLRSYSWTFHAPTRMALGGGFSLYVTDPERRRVIARHVLGLVYESGKILAVGRRGQRRVPRLTHRPHPPAALIGNASDP